MLSIKEYAHHELGNNAGVDCNAQYAAAAFRYAAAEPLDLGDRWGPKSEGLVPAWPTPRSLAQCPLNHTLLHFNATKFIAKGYVLRKREFIGRDFPYWQSSGSKGSHNETVAS